MGGYGKKWGNGGNITANRSRDVFQNIFAHDSIVCKNFLKLDVFQFSRDICTGLPLPPYGRIKLFDEMARYITT